ncbi:hypothetical protein BV22DRAFT_1017395 [Leucogyrophana mollusca]|uniref:Uncharacterized protein n=1 Tax=Leucogyrophana mollusca TaxID=85980 RepID=A0ACB8B9U3_9AGAM|nr:hypothetical protein BV22DRAFT_1017395 [Leucogyrophana mollusca]
MPVLPTIDALPPIAPRFFVPRLVDKPQNPIIHTIELEAHYAGHPPLLTPQSVRTHRLQTENPVLQKDDSRDLGLLWIDAATYSVHHRERVMSWDALSRSGSTWATSTPFLSEQSSQVFASFQHRIRPTLVDPSVNVVRVEQLELLQALQMVVLGTSSFLHVWDPISETFLQDGPPGGKTNLIVIESKDEVVSRSFIQRFLTIGTLLRRLEIFLDTLRRRHASAGPTVHAFSHALSNTLRHLRDNLTRGSPFSGTSFTDNNILAAIWLRYQGFEEVAISLASLCRRDADASPSTYTDFPALPVPLLSRIYEHLSYHVEKSSPPTVTAIHAYLLTISSRGYIQDLCQSIAYGGDRSQKIQVPLNAHDLEPSTLFDENVNEDEREGLGNIEMEDNDYPTFVPRELADIFPAARKSLNLLLAAKPDHDVLQPPASLRHITWIWTEAEIKAAWDDIHDGKAPSDSPSDNSPLHSQKFAQDHPPNIYKPDLADFQIFDMDPGSFSHQTLLGLPAEKYAAGDLNAFITAFPESLPATTPDLSILSSLIFSPLVAHAASLSRALLSLFMDQNSSLCLHAHLVLLRSYLLLTSHSFKSRLSTALFSDSDGREVLDHGLKAFTLSRHKSHSAGAKPSSSGRWAVGLAPFLTDRDTWPPGGADLSFFLRTVIVDSLESSRTLSDDTDQNEGLRRILTEAEFRLGFAIRDLPTGTGRDRWLNPLCEALDFLYLDYKVPHPLDVLITPSILSKYQRVFAFILRMLRVEAAIRATYRMTRSERDPLFPTLVPSNKLLLHFRFVAHSFVNTLSSYVFGTAIGGNFDVFLSRVQPPHSETSDEFPDVFSLADSHSVLLDDILSACLLRSGQRAVGDLLRGTLELVLEFCVLVGDLKARRLEEYRAASALEVLYGTFRKKMSNFIKTLEALLERDTKSWQRQEMLFLRPPDAGAHNPPGGLESLYHLLSQLDIGEWWKGSMKD